MIDQQQPTELFCSSAVNDAAGSRGTNGCISNGCGDTNSSNHTSNGADHNSAGAALVCGSCCQPICDRYLLKAGDVSYHESCLVCCSCAVPLLGSCFTRNNKLFCRIDYERLFGPVGGNGGKNHCLTCGEKIESDEFVMRSSGENIFHLKCFICVVCGGRLQKGDQYVIKQSQLFCRLDYEKEVEMLQGCNYDDYCPDEYYNSRIDGRRGPKRPRTILTTQQRRAFKASFDITPKPCRKIREGLAKDTGLSIRIVQVWFQNQRAKIKKIQKKQQTANVKVKAERRSDSPQDESSDTESKSPIKIKEELTGSNPSADYLHHHHHHHQGDSCSDNECGNANTGISGDCGSNTGISNKASCDSNSFRPSMLFGSDQNENVTADCERRKIKSENASGDHGEFLRGIQNFGDHETNKPDLPTHPLMPVDFSHLQSFNMNINGAGDTNSNIVNNNTNRFMNRNLNQINHHPLANPIDRLYSMQNSYFFADGGGGNDGGMHMILSQGPQEDET